MQVTFDQREEQNKQKRNDLTRTGMKKLLTHWYLEDDSSVVAYEKGEAVTFAELKHRCATILNHVQQSDALVWGVYEENPVNCLAAILSLWHCHKIPCLLGDHLQASNKHCSLHIDAVLQVSSLTLEKGVIDSIQTFQTIQTLEPIEDDQSLYFLTSGSTGQPKRIEKKLHQCVEEAFLLSQRWPVSDNTTTLGCVSHQHLYGFTFRLMWPFLSQRPFESHLCLYSEDLARLSVFYPRTLLVSSPSHLGRLNTQIDWLAFGESCELVLSSAAPLSEELSESASQKFGQPVFEIYGSTETGIIAWRSQQLQGNRFWTAFPGIQIEAVDGLLQITSPLSDQNLQQHLQNKPLIVQDRITIHGDQFELTGRADRIVKLEGKRLSLTALEQQVLSHAAINAVHALIVSLKNRDEVAVACELDQAYLQQNGAVDLRALKQSIIQDLKSVFPSVLVPRRWRFVDHFPVNHQSKTATREISEWFTSKRGRWPQILERQILEKQVCDKTDVQKMQVNDSLGTIPPCTHILKMNIPGSLDFFKGHFDEVPILPGVVQLDWAIHYGRSIFQIKSSFKRLEVIKFQQVIQPDSSVTLVLVFKPDSNKLMFTYENEQQHFSSGRICFA